MCGRFQSTTSPAELARLFKTIGPLPNTTPRYNAAPRHDLPIVLHGPGTGQRRLVALRWGLIPFWAKDAKIGYTAINAMAETVATTRAFRDAFKSRRCLVPADAFYEWKKIGARIKQPYRFAMADGTPFAFAGLWDFAGNEAMRRFTIITCQANALCAPIHNRMPVILDSIDHLAWLGEVSASADDLQGLLHPFPAERMEAHAIAPRIGNLKNDDAALIERASVQLPE
jgi:putative SOS response-associated peptidase YedK